MAPKILAKIEQKNNPFLRSVFKRANHISHLSKNNS